MLREPPCLLHAWVYSSTTVYEGDGLKIQEIIAKGPFAVKKTDVTAGCIIEKIDGEPILKDTDYYPMLEGKAGKNVQLSIYNPQNGKTLPG